MLKNLVNFGECLIRMELEGEFQLKLGQFRKFIYFYFYCDILLLVCYLVVGNVIIFYFMMLYDFIFICFVFSVFFYFLWYRLYIEGYLVFCLYFIFYFKFQEVIVNWFKIL